MTRETQFPGEALARRAFALCALLTAVAALAAPAVALAAGGVTVWRACNPYTGEHVFTLDEGEYNRLGSVGWRREGAAWEAPSSGDPVYRLYNPWSGDHHYTTSKAEYNSLGGAGWKQEDIAFYSASSTGKPVYRLFNPYASIGTHHYTTSLDEYAELPGSGWGQEAIGWYAIGNGSLPSNWTTYTGTFIRTTERERYEEVTGRNWSDDFISSATGKSPLLLVIFDPPETFGGYSNGPTYDRVTTDSLDVTRVKDAFRGYETGRKVTVAVDENSTIFPWDLTNIPGMGEAVARKLAIVG